jgi:hypothetical protein
MSSPSDVGSATLGDAFGHAGNGSSPHVEDGKGPVVVAGQDGMTMPGGELREVRKRKKRNNRNKNRGTGFEGESSH